MRLPGVVLLCLALAACAPSADDLDDLLISGARVIDGSGAPAYRADVAIRDGRIARISREPLPAASAERVIDAEGLVVAPGFIDLHAHVEEILLNPVAENWIRQGVTTVVGNPDGGSLTTPASPWPLGPYLDSVARAPLGPNVAYYVGHNALRRAILGMSDVPVTPAALDSMRAAVAEAMAMGTVGLSTGLISVPGTFATTDEIVELARVAGEAGGFYTSHIRDEARDLIPAVAEAIEIGRRAGVPVVIDHHKAAGAPAWGQSARTLPMIDSARAAGVDVMVNQYPYTGSSATIAQLIPNWALEGGDSALFRRVEDPALRDSIARYTLRRVNDDFAGDLRNLQFARVDWDPSLSGTTIHDWAVARGIEPTPEAAAPLVVEAMRNGGAGMIYLGIMDEGDIDRIMRHPQTMIASDGRLARLGEGFPHPRGYGTFPRVLGHYVRERGALTLEEAVRKMTSMPASRLGLTDRGTVAEGAWADLVVFDPATVADRATYAAPHQYPAGIPYVLVNGVLTVDGGETTSARGGRLLR